MKKSIAAKHTDSTICLEGTRSAPRAYKACCEMFADHTEACVYDIRYEWWSKARHWVIAIADPAGGGGITIDYCPHCGTKFVPTE